MTATENERVTPVSIGTARSSGPSVQDFLAVDSRSVPESLLDHSSASQGATDIPKSRYVDAGFAELENEYLWANTWQMACMEVDLQNPGDHVVYDVANQSLIVTPHEGRRDQGFSQFVFAPRYEVTQRRRPGGVVPLSVPRLEVGP